MRVLINAPASLLFLHFMLVDGNNDEVANAVFKEVLGQRLGYARGLGHSVILDPSHSLCNNRDYQRICEENERNKNNADLYKSKLEALQNDLVTFRNYFEDYEKWMNIRMTELESHRESHEEAPTNV